MKRAIFGTHHSISEAHLTRYLTEWDFKWNTRKLKDGERAALALKGIEGKRLTYRISHQTTNTKAAKLRGFWLGGSGTLEAKKGRTLPRGLWGFGGVVRK
jgi:hypothetical protein